MPEGGSVGPLLIASKKGPYRHPFDLEVSSGCKRHLFPRIARPSDVVGKGGIVEEHRRSTRPLVVHRLPLAIGGLNRTVLGLEISERSRLSAKALANRVK